MDLQPISTESSALLHSLPLWQTQTLVTALLTGLIWLVQVVHYPSFEFVDRTRFADFEAFHSQRITWIVAPLMVAEVVCAGLILLGSVNLLNSINFVSVVLIWLITFFVSVPYHTQLANGFDSQAWQGLVATNWWRTGLWTLRLGFCSYFWHSLLR